MAGRSWETASTNRSRHVSAERPGHRCEERQVPRRDERAAVGRHPDPGTGIASSDAQGLVRAALTYRCCGMVGGKGWRGTLPRAPRPLAFVGPGVARRTLIMDVSDLASHIDHTVLKPDARRTDIERACEVARQLGCAGVCVNPIHVALARQLLQGSSVLVVGVVGFPFGATHTAVKVLETELAIRDGADEVDMVIAIGQLRDGELESVERSE